MKSSGKLIYSQKHIFKFSDNACIIVFESFIKKNVCMYQILKRIQGLYELKEHVSSCLFLL